MNMDTTRSWDDINATLTVKVYRGNERLVDGQKVVVVCVLRKTWETFFLVKTERTGYGVWIWTLYSGGSLLLFVGIQRNVSSLFLMGSIDTRFYTPRGLWMSWLLPVSLCFFSYFSLFSFLSRLTVWGLFHRTTLVSLHSQQYVHI